MITKIHHLNCGTLCPAGGRLVNRSPAKMICHCLLIESTSGLILVDTALGTRDVLQSQENLSFPFRLFAQPSLDIEETAVRQIEKLGFSKADVQHIILTHLDMDHAGGLSDFPDAKIHVFSTEFNAATNPAGLIERLRYHSSQWRHQPKWVVHEQKGESWFGFNSVRQLEGLPPEILLIPLAGHTRGHCGIAVEASSGWLLHAGDAYYFQGEMDPLRPRSSLGLSIFQRVMEMDREKRLLNQVRLRKLIHHHGDQIKVFCSHDPAEFESFSNISH